MIAPIPEDLKEMYKTFPPMHPGRMLIERIAKAEAERDLVADSWKKEEKVWRHINHEAAIKAQQMQSGAEELIAELARARATLKQIEAIFFDQINADHTRGFAHAMDRINELAARKDSQ